MRWACALVILLACVALVLLRFRHSYGPADASGRPTSRLPGEFGDRPSTVDKISKPDLESASGPDEGRAPVATRVLGGRLLTTGGTPIPGATLTWTALTAEDLEWEPSWQDDD